MKNVSCVRTCTQALKIGVRNNDFSPSSDDVQLGKHPSPRMFITLHLQHQKIGIFYWNANSRILHHTYVRQTQMYTNSAVMYYLLLTCRAGFKNTDVNLNSTYYSHVQCAHHDERGRLHEREEVLHKQAVPRLRCIEREAISRNTA